MPKSCLKKCQIKVQISKVASEISGYFYINVNLKRYFRFSQLLLKLL